jgi:hypothetical protein
MVHFKIYPIKRERIQHILNLSGRKAAKQTAARFSSAKHSFLFVRQNGDKRREPLHLPPT